MIFHVYIDNFLPLKAEFKKMIKVGDTKGHTTNFDKVFYPIRLKFLRLLCKTIILTVAFYGLKICILIEGNIGLNKMFGPKKNKVENLGYFIRGFMLFGRFTYLYWDK
jgi:hypothetical protein